MLQRSRRPYVCRQCLAREPGSLIAFHIRHSGGSQAATRIPQRVGSQDASHRLYQHLQHRWATTWNSPPAAAFNGRLNPPQMKPARQSSPQGCAKPAEPPIREQLRRWEIAHDKQPSNMPPDVPMPGSIANSLSRTQSTGSSIFDLLKPTDSGNTDCSGGESVSEDAERTAVGVGSRSPGDLVELRQGISRAPVIGVYLGFFSHLHHFYAANGKWFTSTWFSSLFTVSKFASLTELGPVLAKIPKNATPEQIDDLRRNDQGPSREDGAGLIRKMTDFKTRSESVYQDSSGRLERPQTVLSRSPKAKYLSLSEIADILLPSSLKRSDDDNFPPSALYAVHTALFRNEFGFCPITSSKDCSRLDHLFEVFPEEHANVVDRVVAIVREYAGAIARLPSPLPRGEMRKLILGRFVFEAREVVRSSRSIREWTPHGILKTSPGVQLPRQNWATSSQEIIRFLEWWASYDLFHPGSRLHSYGALILRALDLYGGIDLDQSTAWTFLQEIGMIAPWEIPSRYKARFPNLTIARDGGLKRQIPRDLESSKRPDVAARGRKQRTGSTIFCIDAPSTMVIDDAVSVEYTDKPDEFWIHIHTADPASTIKPTSELCKFMELIPENIYLPGHFQAMLPSELGEEGPEDCSSESLVKQFSLHTGAPALTFSARVNDTGDILEYKIEPSTLGDVLYLDPDDVSRFCDEPPPPPLSQGHCLSVGTRPEHGTTAPERPMVAAEDLDESSKNDLLTLYRLAEAMKQRRLAKGAWPYFTPRPTVSVSFNEVSAGQESSNHVKAFPADPYIEVSREPSTSCSVVTNSMVLAGEIAAGWCSSRDIPIPYRRDSKSAQNFDAAFAYATKEIYPRIKQGIELTQGQRQELVTHTGEIEVSSRPGPYFVMGLEMYAKATSPLRRFSDLLVHWQVHAALAYERRARRQINPSVDDVESFLPFTAAELDKMLPLLALREKMARRVTCGTFDWILIALVRAWRFEGTAPRSLRFTVSSRWSHGLIGRLNLFDLYAELNVDGLDGCLLIKDTRVGDEFEVELTDINVYSRRILVKATRYLGQTTADGRPGAAHQRCMLPEEQLTLHTPSSTTGQGVA